MRVNQAQDVRQTRAIDRLNASRHLAMPILRREYTPRMLDDLAPVTVYSGSYTEAVFLKSLIESAGIDTALVMALVTGYRRVPYLTVRRRDAERARELVEDFLRNGKRTE